jgi:hypothetical protein
MAILLLFASGNSGGADRAHIKKISIKSFRLGTTHRCKIRLKGRAARGAALISKILGSPIRRIVREKPAVPGPANGKGNKRW